MRPFFLGKWTSPGTPPQIAIPTVTPEVQSEVPSENGTASIISCNRLGPEPGAASVLGDKSAGGSAIPLHLDRAQMSSKDGSG